MTTLGSDTFTRTNVASPSWGTATGGGSWARPFGSATTYSVTSNEGIIATTPGTWDHFTLGSTFSYASTMDVVVRVIVDNTASIFGVLLRVSSAGTTSYKVQYDGAGHLIMYYDSPGTGLVQIGSTAAFTVSVSSAYHVRGELVGTTLMGKIWLDGSAEPGSWTISSSVGANTIASGGFGVVGSANTNLKFDNFIATDSAFATNQPVVNNNIVATTESLSASLKVTIAGISASVESTLIAQSITLSNITGIVESVSAGTFQQVNSNNTTASAESLNASLKATLAGVTASIEVLLAAQRSTQSNTTAFIEQVIAQNMPVASTSDPSAQMLYGDLLLEYAVLRASPANAYIAKIGIALYVPAKVLNEFAIPGYLAVRLNGQDWSQHTKLKTINDVIAFIAAHP